MDISFTPEQENFRHKVSEWLANNWNPSIDRLPDNAEERAQFLREWDRKLFDAGFAGIACPKEYGGQGLTQIEEIILNEELGKVNAPEGNIIGKILLAPTLLVLGTDEQKKRYIPKILTAEEVWCQGFSEPNAGSDLASLSTKATLDGDHWVLNGQKVWTSFAPYSDWIFVLARTNPEAKKHHGITFFLVPLNSPGITVRPLVQITGDKEFGEVFFEDVRIPKDSYVGNVNEGWKVANTLLSFERGTYIFGLQSRTFYQLNRLISLSREVSNKKGTVSKQSYFRQKLAQFYAETMILRYHALKTAGKVEKGEKIGEEASIHKLFWSELHQRIGELAMEIQGELAHIAGKNALDQGIFQHLYLFSRCSTIIGGTSQIQKNIIAERILGMPR